MEDVAPYGEKESERKRKIKREELYLKPKNMQEWLTLIILLLVFYLAWAYWRDISALNEVIENLRTVCSCP